MKAPGIRERLRVVLMDGQWHTGLELARAIGREAYTTGIAAKVRALRDREYGGYTIESERVRGVPEHDGRQVWRFRMALASEPSGQLMLAPSATGWL